MASFVSGLVSGNVSQASKMKKQGSSGVLRKKKKGGVPGGILGPGGALSAGDYKRGGKVKRTGMAHVHKGERVLTPKQAKRYRSKKR